MTRLEQAKLFLDFYFAPWGAAKGAIWEDISEDHPFSAETALTRLSALLNGIEFSKEDIKSIKVVTG